MYRENPLRKKLQAGEKVFGPWSQLTHPAITEILSLVGFDFILVDNEHGPGDPLSISDQLRASAQTDTVLVVRIPWNDQVMMKKYLDVGVEAVMVPMIETAEEAEAAVAAMRYPPRGIRGIAHTDIRGSDYGLKAMEYLETASDNIFKICQIESMKAIENLDEIVAVEGIDMFLIGPFDLSASLGYPAQFDRQDHKDMMAKAEAAIKGAGKYLATTPYGGRTAQELFDRGYDLIVGGCDVALLREGAKTLWQENNQHK